MKLAFETDQGSGPRAVLGAIVLETDETLEVEFARMMRLDGVALYHSRIPMVSDVTSDTLARMEVDLPKSASLFPSTLAFDVIGYGCTSASAVIGSDRVAAAVQSVFPGAQVTDPLAALVAAGRHLDVGRLGFLTPYVPELSARMRQKLELAGFEVVSFGSFEEGNDHVVARIGEASIEHAARAVAAQAECDALVIACTNLRCLNVIPRIEQATGIPVLSSNQALAWHMLRLAGIGDRNPALGMLFS